MNLVAFQLLAVLALSGLPGGGAYNNTQRTLEVLKRSAGDWSAIWLQFNVTCHRTHFCITANFVEDDGYIFKTKNDHLKFIPLTCTNTNRLIHETYIWMSGMELFDDWYEPKIHLYHDCPGQGYIREQVIFLPQIEKEGEVRKDTIDYDLTSIGTMWFNSFELKDEISNKKVTRKEELYAFFRGDDLTEELWLFNTTAHTFEADTFDQC